LKYPIRNLIFEKISQTGTTTDTDLMNALQKEGITLADSDFNKTLMDLEIYGLVRVSWLTKDKRRIEMVVDQNTAT
jgi:arginine repressor